MMNEHHSTDYRTKTRCLRPIDNINFTVHEMVTGILTSVSPSSIVSINQLHGDRKGVVRLTFKTVEAAKEMDTKVASRRVQINGVRLATVSETGHFVRLTLVDVPHYLCSEDLERELSVYGSVVNVRREYIEYQGYRLENETRHVLLSSLARDVPKRITLDGHEVFIAVKTVPGQKESPSKTGNASEAAAESDSYISRSNTVPKHVMNSIYSYTVDGPRRGHCTQATESAESGSDREHGEPSHHQRHLADADGGMDYLQPSSAGSKRHHGSPNSPRSLSPLASRKGYVNAGFKGSESDAEEHVGKSDVRDGVRHRDRCRHPDDRRPAASQLIAQNSGSFGCPTREVSRRRSFDCEAETERKVQPQIERYHQRSKTPDRDLRM